MYGRLYSLRLWCCSRRQRSRSREEQGKGQGKKYVIHGKPVERRAVENMMEESIEDGEVWAGKTVSKLKGRFHLDKNKSVEEAAVDFIDRHRNAFGLKNPKAELKFQEKHTIKEGLTYVHFQQTLNGIPVWESIVSVVLDKDNNIKRIGSGNIPTPDVDTTPQITGDEAIKIAKVSMSASANAFRSPKSSLVIYPVGNTLKLAYEVEMLVNHRSWDFMIDAKDGKILRKMDTTSDLGAGEGPATRNGKLWNNTTTTVGVYNLKGQAYLAHSVPNRPEIQEQDFVFGNASTLNVDVTFENFKINHSISAWNYGGDLYLYASGVDDNSLLNPAGGSLTSGVNVLNNHDRVFNYFTSIDNNFRKDTAVSFGGLANNDVDIMNSSWNGYYAVYGRGDGAIRKDLTQALDISAHELGHGVTSNFVNLQNNYGHARTINEHISDLWAIMVDRKNFLIGEDSFVGGENGKCRRNFSDPKDPNQWDERGILPSDHMDNFLYTSFDHFGEHYNVGILNKAAYKLIISLDPAGGPIYNSGRDRVAKIYYQSYQELKKNPKAHFFDLREALVIAAEDIDSSAIAPIFSSFSSVGIKRELPASETFQYDSYTSSSVPPTKSLSGAFGSLFVPYYRYVDQLSDATLAGIKVFLNSGDNNVKRVKVSVLTEGLDAEGNPAKTALLSPTSFEVNRFNKLSFIDLFSSNIIVGDPFYIKIEPDGSSDLSLGYTTDKNPNCNVLLANFSGDYIFNDEHYIIRPIIVYDDQYAPKSFISSMTGEKDSVTFTNNTAYIGKKFFNNNSTIKITGSAFDNDDQYAPKSSISSMTGEKDSVTFTNNTAYINKKLFDNNSTIKITGKAFDNRTGFSGVKRVDLKFDSYSSNVTTPTSTANLTPEDKTDDATWETWEYKWKIKGENVHVPDGTYVFSTKATDMADNPEAAVKSVYAVMDKNPLAPVTDLEADPIVNDYAYACPYGKAIAIYWSYLDDPPLDFDHYNVYRSDTPFSDTSGMQPVSTITEFWEWYYMDYNIEDYKHYYYAVTAVDKAGNEDTKVVNVSCNGGPLGLHAEYYQDTCCCECQDPEPNCFNTSKLNGSPAYTGCDRLDNYNRFHGDVTLPAGITSKFSVRWTGYLKVDNAGNYSFKARNVQDGVRLWIDDQLVINKWIAGSGTNSSPWMNISPGMHSIKIEYFATCWGYWFELLWSKDGAGAWTDGTISEDCSFQNYYNDTQAQTSTITMPLNKTILSGDTCSITGKVYEDLGYKTKQVEVFIDDTWRQALISSPNWGTWNYTWTLPKDRDGKYTIKSRTTDSVGNVEEPGPGVSVVVDNNPPMSFITSPHWGDSVTCNTIVTGTATDGDGSGVDKVEVSIDGGSTWSLATDTSGNGTWATWSYRSNIKNSKGEVIILSKATDKVNHYELFDYRNTVYVQVTVQPDFYFTSPPDQSIINSNSFLVTGRVLDDGTGVSTVRVSTDEGSTWNSVSGLDPWSYLWTIPASGKIWQLMLEVTDTAGNSGYKQINVITTVNDRSELTIANWDSNSSAQGCSLCHIPTDNFLKAEYKADPGFCYSCHNTAASSHDKPILAEGGHVMKSMTAATAAGKAWWPSYGIITSAEYNDSPYTRLKDGDKITCVTCHNTMGKTDDPARVWESTATVDNQRYILQNGGWASEGYMKPIVYRTTEQLAAPQYSKDKKAYDVSQTEYVYNEYSGIITFNSPQPLSTYYYVTLDYPYLRQTTQYNNLCWDCHGENTHKDANCLICHQAHNSGNLSDVRETVHTPDFSDRAVRFTSQTGADSFADGDTNHNSICEVCHTATKYYRRDGLGQSTHADGQDYTGKKCTACHLHNYGFIAQ